MSRQAAAEPASPERPRRTCCLQRDAGTVKWSERKGSYGVVLHERPLSFWGTPLFTSMVVEKRAPLPPDSYLDTCLYNLFLDRY